MLNMSRRGFMSAAAMAAMAGANLAVADEATPAAEFVPAGGSFAEGALGDWNGTPAQIEALGGCTMPLAELNRRRQAYMDAQTEYVCADGTVIPASFVKVRALMNTYGVGVGNTPTDACWWPFLQDLTEELAEFYIKLPMGKRFNVGEAYANTGVPIDECKEKLEYLSNIGLLATSADPNGRLYNQPAFFQGYTEYNSGRLGMPGAYAMLEANGPMQTYGPAVDTGMMGADMLPNAVYENGTFTFYAIPCDKSVVSDPAILPYDDVEAIVRSKDYIALAPCFCRLSHGVVNGEDIPTMEDFVSGTCSDYTSPTAGNVHVETCLQFGAEGEYWVNLGYARRISQEECLEVLARNRDDGLIFQSSFGKDTDTICSCSIQGNCGVLGFWMSAGDAAAQAAVKCFGQVSHYNLEVNTDTCAKCGMCAQRCPLMTIVMDEETGLPVVGPNCFRCGQCAYVCPTESRKLVARDPELNLELPQDYVDANNMQAAYRFEHGFIK